VTRLACPCTCTCPWARAVGGGGGRSRTGAARPRPDAARRERGWPAAAGSAPNCGFAQRGAPTPAGRPAIANRGGRPSRCAGRYTPPERGRRAQPWSDPSCDTARVPPAGRSAPARHDGRSVGRLARAVPAPAPGRATAHSDDQKELFVFREIHPALLVTSKFPRMSGQPAISHPELRRVAATERRRVRVSRLCVTDYLRRDSTAAVCDDGVTNAAPVPTRAGARRRNDGCAASPSVNPPDLCGANRCGKPGVTVCGQRPAGLGGRKGDRRRDDALGVGME
jgi:hypothetical protein